MRILLIEDDIRLSRIIERVLKQEGFEVDVAHDGEAGLDLALNGTFDGVIVDRMLPRRDGLSLIRELRSARIGTPALMLTARGELPDRVEGLDAGADDYLGKPFAFEELLARLRALLRRTGLPLVDQRVTIGDITVDLAARTVHRRDTAVALTHQEFVLLDVLIRHRGRTLSRDQLLEQVWGFDADPQGNVVDLYIHYLRRKLGDDPAHPLIRTVRGAGYMISGD